MKKLNLECKNCHERSRPLAGSRPQLCKSIKTNFFREARPQRILLISFFAVFFAVSVWFGFSSVAEAAPTVSAINPTSGTNNGTTSITSVTGTAFTSGWDKENGLVGNWRLDETTGSTTADVSGSSNTGTLNNFTSGTPWTTGKLGNALNFDGVDDYVDVGSPASLDNLSAMTISGWMKPRTMGESGQGRIMEKRGLGGNAGWEFTPNGTNAIDFLVDHATSALIRRTANNVFSFNAWTHVALTWDGSITAANAKIYVNGVETTYQITQNAVGARVDESANNLVIGNRSASKIVTFDGFLDEVRVYNRVITTSEISDLYNATSGPGYVKLEKVGLPDITCTGFTLTSSTTLSSGGCPLDGVATGVRNVQVTNPDNTVGTLTDGFTVNSASAPPDATLVTYTVGGNGAQSGHW